ncbi:xylulokinase [Agaribacterium haliotis]|uniref:xylulokinase n=1 Tax=Agaribacterium haliotis TaxID=2013869 RepID=UPI000BB564C3|nr:FGGY family carbohydrate kinase [Agaribacterium haliotis]
MYTLGIDLGTSSVKLSLFDAQAGAQIDALTSPETEFEIISSQPGWAEQEPELWWQAVEQGITNLLARNPGAGVKVRAIGIAYQMHGLVAVDKQRRAVCPSIIWCDSRAVDVGATLGKTLGERWCKQRLLNTPGNFTLSKLLWLKQHKAETFKRIDKIMLPGDYIAMRLSGRCTTSASGLSEATLWDFVQSAAASDTLQKAGLSSELLPELKSNLGIAATLKAELAKELGLGSGAGDDVVLSYRAGDQVNNALSLGAFKHGDIAASAGTSGVIYGVSNTLICDETQRINSFLHIAEPGAEQPLGLLACINGAGRMYSWLKQLLDEAGSTLSYQQLSELSATAPVASEGLMVLPFGNGAERLLGNHAAQRAQIEGLDLNRHGLAHMARAVQEGVAFAMAMGMKQLESLGFGATKIVAAHDSLFLSEVFRQSLSDCTGLPIQLFSTSGAEGAARAAAWGCAFYQNAEQAFVSLEPVGKEIQPSKHRTELKQQQLRWLQLLKTKQPE